MNLHNDTKLFSDTIRAAAQHLRIKDEFVEKDYWITLLLNGQSIDQRCYIFDQYTNRHEQ